MEAKGLCLISYNGGHRIKSQSPYEGVITKRLTRCEQVWFLHTCTHMHSGREDFVRITSASDIPAMPVWETPHPALSFRCLIPSHLYNVQQLHRKVLSTIRTEKKLERQTGMASLKNVLCWCLPRRRHSKPQPQIVKSHEKPQQQIVKSKKCGGPYFDDPQPLPQVRPRKLSNPSHPTLGQHQSPFFSKLPLEIRQMCYAKALRESFGLCHVYHAVHRMSYIGCHDPSKLSHLDCWRTLEDTCLDTGRSRRRRDWDSWTKSQVDQSGFRKSIQLQLLVTCRRV